MKIRTPIPTVLTQTRRERNLSQQALADLAGFDRRRLSQFEAGLRLPNEKELGKWAEVVGVSLTRVLEESDWKPPVPGRPASATASRIREAFAGHRETYTHPTRLAFEACWRAAWKNHNAAMVRLSGAVEARTDLRLVEGFLYDLPCDSGLEALFDQHLLAGAWRPIQMSPMELGYADPRLLDPQTDQFLGHRLFRGFGFANRKMSAAILAQVPIHAFRRYVMDYLAAFRFGQWRVMANIEVDGRGHDPTGDAERRGHIRLPELRLSEKRLEHPDFWPWFLDQARQLCLKHGRPTLRLLDARDMDRETARAPRSSLGKPGAAAAS